MAEPKPKKGKVKDPSKLEVQIMPGEPSKAQIMAFDDENSGRKGPVKRDLSDSKSSNSTRTQFQDPIARDVPVAGLKISNRTTSDVSKDPVTGLPIDMSGAKNAIGNALDDWDCTPQGLEGATPQGRNKFSMGGGQDSTYEYFPKVGAISQSW